MLREYPKGRVFVEEGEPATDLFNVTDGTVKLFKMLPDGRQQIIGFATAGHFLGLSGADTYTFSAEAIEPVKACRFSRPKLYKLLDSFPLLEKRLLETACNELVIAHALILMLGRKTAKGTCRELSDCVERQPDAVRPPGGEVAPADDAWRHRRPSRADHRDSEPNLQPLSFGGPYLHSKRDRRGDHRPSVDGAGCFRRRLKAVRGLRRS